MSQQSAIQWTDATWNPTTGCTKVSPGCAHCYIERTPPFRIHGRQFVKGHIPLEFHANRYEQPLHWKRPRRIFVNSLSDLFHESVPTALLDRLYCTMEQARQHQYQILTKRPERMRDYLDWRYGEREDSPGFRIPVRHIWHGVTVENRVALWRLEHLRRTRSAIRFVSFEPLLGDLGNVDMAGIHWAIVGGESGPKARRFHWRWALNIVDACKGANVPCFVKQLGENVEIQQGCGDCDPCCAGQPCIIGYDIRADLLE